MRISFPKIRIDFKPLADAERLVRQLGLSAMIEGPAMEAAAQEMAKSGLKPWQLRSLAKVATRAAAIKEAGTI